MSNSEKTVSIPCRTCDELLQVDIPDSASKHITKIPVTLELMCEDHGRFERQLKRVIDPTRPWTYLDGEGNELGRGSTPQDAINRYHEQNMTLS